jgi:hypothetical protein
LAEKLKINQEMNYFVRLKSFPTSFSGKETKEIKQNRGYSDEDYEFLIFRNCTRELFLPENCSFHHHHPPRNQTIIFHFPSIANAIRAQVFRLLLSFRAMHWWIAVE